VFFQYQYIESGTVNGILTFDSIQLNGTYISTTPGPGFLASNFANYFIQNNIVSLLWSINVTNKLYQPGILPKAMVRGQTGNPQDDEDFLNTWRTVTHFFGLFVALAREFQTFYQNHDILLEYLTQRGSLLANDVLLDDLFYLMCNYLDEVRQRGTRQVFLKKGTRIPGIIEDEFDISISQAELVLPTHVAKPIDGEYLRFIGYNIMDEFLYNLNQNKHIGWNIGNSSPLYKGLEGRLNLNKYYCDFFKYSTLAQLSITSASLPYISRIEDPLNPDEGDSISWSESISESGSFSESGDEVVIEIKAPPLNGVVGLGGGGRKIVVNPNLDYEVTFFIRADSFTLGRASGKYSGDFWSGSGTGTVTMTFSDGQIATTSIVSGASSGPILAAIVTAINSQTTYTASTTGVGLTITAPVGLVYNGITCIQSYTVVTSGFQFLFNAPGTTITLTGASTNAPSFDFGIYAWDQNNNVVDTYNIKTLAISSYFLSQATLNKQFQYYFVRGILYNCNTYQPYNSGIPYDSGIIVSEGGAYYRANIDVPAGVDPSSNPTYWKSFTNTEILRMFPTNIGQGNNLIMSSNVIQIDPFILYNNVNGSSSNLYLYNVRVQPLRTQYSKGFIQTTNFLELFTTNNNLALSNDQIDLKTRKYLIPANVVMKTNYLDSAL
jgi:hypothetical protein